MVPECCDSADCRSFGDSKKKKRKKKHKFYVEDDDPLSVINLERVAKAAASANWHGNGFPQNEGIDPEGVIHAAALQQLALAANTVRLMYISPFCVCKKCSRRHPPRED